MNLKKHRIISKFSQMQLAHKAGISQCHLSSLERNVKQPTLPVLKRLAAARGISVAEVIDDGDNPRNAG